MNHWIFQANPNHYDISAALEGLSQIAWRVPQYTGDIQPGDRVCIWRSGKEAGIVGVGTVVSPPALRPVPDKEMAFVLKHGQEGGSETRVLLRTKVCSFVPKATVAALAELKDHAIVKAPMGTVFPLSSAESQALDELVDCPHPEAPLITNDGLPWPQVFSWSDRTKDAYPLPGGNEQQLTSLVELIRIVAERRPTMDHYRESVAEQFGLSASNARHVALFVRRTGFVLDRSGLLEPSPLGRLLLEEPNRDLVLAKLHQRVRFIGEMLEQTLEPKSSEHLLRVANSKYEMGWTTKAQIQRRCSWLSSLGVIETHEGNQYRITEHGRLMLSKLSIEQPLIEPSDEGAANVVAESASAVVVEPAERRSLVDELVEELLVSSTDSGTPDRFEHAIAAALRYLGFNAKQLGGAGKTDVVADADLGRDDKYRVIIDGKTTATGAVNPHQVDWDTIEEHRKQHEADFVVIAGPAFSGSRIINRATDHSATLITADDLAELLRQHALVPLSLDSYRTLFDAPPGEIDLEGLTEAVDSQQRFVAVAQAVMDYVHNHAGDVGALSARDLYLLLRGDSDLDAGEEEIAEALKALASPLVGALVEAEQCFRPSSSRHNTVMRLQLLAEMLGSS